MNLDTNPIATAQPVPARAATSRRHVSAVRRYRRFALAERLATALTLMTLVIVTAFWHATPTWITILLGCSLALWVVALTGLQLTSSAARLDELTRLIDRDRDRDR